MEKLRISELKPPHLTNEELGRLLGFSSRAYVQEFLAGRKGLTIKNLKKSADILHKYPSELLPLEWQKPSSATVDKNILTEAIKASIKFYEKYHKEYNIPADALSEIAAAAYQEIIAEGVEPSSNVIYMSMVNKFKGRA